MLAGQTLLGKLEWNPEPGEYRFVAGGEDSQTMQQFNVDWSYSASLKSGFAIGAMILGNNIVDSAAYFISKSWNESFKKVCHLR